ncbi:hypothetical protein A2W24_02995 [Microgenomates group bacterium RBG_16_45_19]|nr:MAG: hypothetical protein A2W24_02995 [Microgenomates group bacterium RBG_16_45_19]
MSVQDWFYFWGMIFFFSWFVFLVVMTISMVVMYKQVKTWQAAMDKRLDEMQNLIKDKLNQPMAGVLMGVLPWLISAWSTSLKRWKR